MTFDRLLRQFRGVLALGLAGIVATAAGADDLERQFLDPPAAARPAGYWAWINGHVEVERFEGELREWKSKGLSKAYIFECGARDKQGIVPVGPAFMSDASVRAIGAAIRAAGRVGIELGFTTSSSWNAGGSWVEPPEASMGLYVSELAVRGPRQFAEPLPFPAVPAQAPKRADGRPAFAQEVAVLALAASAPVDREAAPKAAGKESAVQPLADVRYDPTQVIDLTDRLDGMGRLVWEVPDGAWRIVRFVCSNTGQKLAIPSPESQGLAIDHFSPAATRSHFDFLVKRLEGEVGPLRETALTTLYLCSYELRGAAWTPRFLEEFRARRGYTLVPYLPLLFGAQARDQEAAERVVYDYRKTQGDLLVDAFYRTAAESARSRGLLLCAEAGGPGPPTHNVPVDALKAQGAIDVPRGEFWTDLNLWVVKETACAAHVYGKPIVDMEAFTSWSHWQEGPFELKPFADRAFCEGANHLTFHTCPHTPSDAGLPGWVYNAGTHIGPQLTWWPLSRPFFDYLARCSYLLQQGQFVADVCYYYGDQGYNFVPPKHVDPSLGPGYDYDVVNAEVLLDRMETRQGKLALPQGPGYQLLVLPDRPDIDLAVLKKLERLVADGATIVGPKPTRSSGFLDYQRRDAEVRRLADELWGPCDGQRVSVHSHGKGKVVWGQTLRQVLSARGIGADFTFASADPEANLDYLHRRAAGAEIYFVANRGARPVAAECTFRVTGKQPERWLPESGRSEPMAVFRQTSSHTAVPLELAPFGSVFVVFRKSAPRRHLVAVEPPEGTSRPGAFRMAADPANPEAASLIGFAQGVYRLRFNDQKSASVRIETLPQPQIHTRPWIVHFPKGWGAPESATFDKPISWTEHAHEGIKYFSGMATYESDWNVELPRESEWRATLELGQVKNVAAVWINDEPSGVVWQPPFQLDVTGKLRQGPNRLRIAIANTWSNRLVGDAKLPPERRYCRTNMTESLTWKTPWAQTPLLPSGLLGPVRLTLARVVAIPQP